MIRVALTAAAVAVAGVAVPAGAAVTVQASQVGSDVVITTTGTLDTTGLTRTGPGGYAAYSVSGNAIFTGSDFDLIRYTGFFGPSSFGPGTATINGAPGPSGFRLFGIVTGPSGVAVYTSDGGGLSSSATFANQTFRSLGLTAGSYVFNAPADQVIVNIGPSVPEPTTWAMMIAGFGLVGATMRRRQAGRPINGVLHR